MTVKDILIIIAIVIASVGISLFVGYKYAMRKDKEQSEWISTQTEEIREQRLVLDSLRLAGNQTITIIEKRYFEAKRPIPIIDNEDSLLISVNQILNNK